MIRVEIEVRLILLGTYTEVIVDSSDGGVGALRVRLFITESEFGVDSCKGGNRDIEVDIDAMLSCCNSLLVEIIEGVNKSSCIRVVCLTLLPRTAELFAWRELFNAMSINLAAMGGT